jgi:transaldolase
MNVKIYADGADLAAIERLAADPAIQGFTTNPTLMRQAGIVDYERFAKEALNIVGERPISFEVLADEFAEMERQARIIATWGPNVYVKIPVTNGAGAPATELVHRLAHDGVHVNVTAIFTMPQVAEITAALADGAASNVSVFAGRIADAGVDPIPVVEEALTVIRPHEQIEMIWASPREVLNIVQADVVGCHIITVTPDLLKKLPSLGKDLGQFSLETVRMFLDDAVAAGFTL